ncbi:DUF1223 domain-containing protein [Flagellimonas aquimarina]|jgi:hypothetical protein|uniref:DUF1223 domain-containing protein n=1 Tax=Flagellimonas aquimarina TaxID=2201895 RepID=A0A316L0L0_9FLAO|nr:DUF1223 domain-containing protein [Allomuricauda koreensis]PWL37693.1 DUF1223 domain-containing protein [Allomuricauda koreensis]
MFKKIIIPSMAFLGMSLMAFYTAKYENRVEPENDVVKEKSYESAVVLELFTSQGCSSCPPADMLLEKVKKQYPESVYALSYHVDYWNYIGWEDPFSKSVYTKKQREYNRKFKYRGNYTPQLVINGEEHFVGSSQSKMYTKLNEYKIKKASNAIDINIGKTGDNSIAFDYAIEGDLIGKQLRIVLVLDERTTSVKRGENRNRVLKNSNIVVAEKYIPVSAKKGESSITVPKLVSSDDKLTLIVLIESNDLDITGAAKKPISR